MRIASVALFTVTALTVASGASAKTRHTTLVTEDLPYYIELGTVANEEDALQQWREVSDHFPQELAKLTFFPVNVTQIVDGKNKTVTRVQAGPIKRKVKAQAICSRLFSEDTPCFVIEGKSQIAPPKLAAAVAEVTEDTSSLPWHSTGAEGNEELLASANVDEEKPVEEEKESGFLPWLFGSSDEEKLEEKSAEKPIGEAKAEVAEAIRVPLTEDVPTQAVVMPPQEIKPVSPPMPEPVETPIIADSDEGGWLNVAAFYDEDNATGFWQDVRGRAPSLAAGLRVRVVRPLLSRSRSSVVLNIGPFASAADAMEFCNQGVKPLNDDLACRFENKESVQTAGAQVISPRYQHGNLYEARRRMLLANRGRRTTASVTHATHSREQYWAQVATAKSQVKALQAWEDLRSAHPDLLDGARGSVSASLGRNSDFMVRIGPMESRDEAIDLCSKLQEKGTSCKVYSNM